MLTGIALGARTSSAYVVAYEVDADLAARAAANLAAYPNVTVHSADGAELDAGAFDAMFINAGVTHPHRPWLRSLNQGGRLILPIAVPLSEKGLGAGLMLKIVHDGGHFPVHIVSSVAIYSCTNVRDSELEPLIRQALASRTLLNLKSVRLDPHEPSDTCVIHREDVCLSTADPAA